MTPQQELIANAVLAKVVKCSFFSICEITSLCEALGVPVNSQAVKNLRALHCIDFKDMSPPLKREFSLLVQTAIRATDEEWKNILNPKWIIDGDQPQENRAETKVAPIIPTLGWKKLFRLGL